MFGEPIKNAHRGGRSYYGAGDEIRTRDVHLGKVVLYQLSYSRDNKARAGTGWAPGPRLYKITSSHCPTFTGDLSPTIIGAGVLNFRVRNGIGWVHVAVGTKRKK